MFRMLRLKPPNGWNAVAWELAIVTVGVLMALALQQWAEGLTSRSRAALARQAIRQELREHYLNAVEWRTFSPCVTGQLERIEGQVASSARQVRPIATRRLDNVRKAVMAPQRIYSDHAWLGVISGGTAIQLSDIERQQLGNQYWLARQMDKAGGEFVEADNRLLGATRSIELNPEVRLSLLQSIDQIHSANESMDDFTSEMIYWINQFGAAPTRADVAADLRKNSAGMAQFCREEGLPTREIAKAINTNG